MMKIKHWVAESLGFALIIFLINAGLFYKYIPAPKIKGLLIFLIISLIGGFGYGLIMKWVRKKFFKKINH